MKELGKIKKVANPDLTVFVSEALAGQSALIQARKFLEITEFDAFALTKVDVDEKGGTLLSIAIGLDKPILFLGIGQEYEDITLFNLDFIKKMLE
jgi:fused signal recognition particle receptor